MIVLLGQELRAWTGQRLWLSICLHIPAYEEPNAWETRSEGAGMLRRCWQRPHSAERVFCSKGLFVFFNLYFNHLSKQIAILKQS